MWGTRRAVMDENQPEPINALQELTRTALYSLESQGLAVTTAGALAFAMTWDEDATSYRIAIKTGSYIQPHHLRNMELSLGARFGAASLKCNDLGWADTIVIECP